MTDGMKIGEPSLGSGFFLVLAFLEPCGSGIDGVLHATAFGWTFFIIINGSQKMTLREFCLGQ